MKTLQMCFVMAPAYFLTIVVLDWRINRERTREEVRLDDLQI